jgi:hypothetical protein
MANRVEGMYEFTYRSSEKEGVDAIVGSYLWHVAGATRPARVMVELAPVEIAIIKSTAVGKQRHRAQHRVVLLLKRQRNGSVASRYRAWSS